MTVYYLLLFIPLFFKDTYLKNGILCKKRIHVSKTFIFFFFFFLILSCRDFSIGADIEYSYQYIFNRIANLKWNELYALNIDIELGYKILNKIINEFGDYRLLLISISGFSNYLFFRLYYKNDEFQFTRIILFCSIGIFPFLFTGLRQVIALSLGIIAFKYVRKRHIIPFLLVVLIAFSFHKSASILLLLYPIYHFKFRKKYIYYIIPLIIIVFFLKNNLFLFMLQFLGQKYINDYSEITATGAFNMLFLYLFFLLFCLIIPDEAKINHEVKGLRNILIFIVILQIFASINTVAMRMNYYFIIFIPLLIPEIIDISKKKYTKLVKVLIRFICFFLTFYFFYQGYFGTDMLQIFPYVPFWR